MNITSIKKIINNNNHHHNKIALAGGFGQQGNMANFKLRKRGTKTKYPGKQRNINHFRGEGNENTFGSNFGNKGSGNKGPAHLGGTQKGKQHYFRLLSLAIKRPRMLFRIIG